MNPTIISAILFSIVYVQKGNQIQHYLCAKRLFHVSVTIINVFCALFTFCTNVTQ